MKIIKKSKAKYQESVIKCDGLHFKVFQKECSKKWLLVEIEGDCLVLVAKTKKECIAYLEEIEKTEIYFGSLSKMGQ